MLIGAFLWAVLICVPTLRRLALFWNGLLGRKRAPGTSSITWMTFFVLDLVASSFILCGHVGVLFTVFQHFGIPLAVEKTEGPSTTFLGIELDSIDIEC